MLMPNIQGGHHVDAGGGAFTPASLFGGGDNGGWWDWSDLSTMFQNTDGTSAVSSPGDRIGYVGDKSGIGDAITADGNNNTRPVYLSGGGGQLLNSEGRRLTAALSAAMTSAAVYSAVVMEPAVSENVGNARYLSYSAAGQQDWDNVSRATTMYTNGGAMTTYRNAALSSAPYTSGSLALFESVFDGINHTMYVDGAAGAVLPIASSFNFDLIGFGCEPQGAAGGNYVNGKIMEGFVVGRALTAGEVLNLRSYFNTKWGL